MQTRGKNIWKIASEIATVILTLVTCAFTFLQYQINKRQMNLNIEQQQPTFQVSFYDWQSLGSAIYDHTDVTISNTGEIARGIKSVTIDTYLQFRYSPDYPAVEISTWYVPIKDYFNCVFPTGDLQGEIAKTYSLKYPNNLYYDNLYKTASEYVFTSSFVALELKHITHIVYVDKFGTERESFLVNKNIVDKEDALKITTSSLEQFGFARYDINSLTVQNLIIMIEQEGDNKESQK